MYVSLKNLPIRKERETAEIQHLSPNAYLMLSERAVYNWSELDFFFYSTTLHQWWDPCLKGSSGNVVMLFLSFLASGLSGSLLLPVIWCESMHYLYTHSTDIYLILTMYFAYYQVLVPEKAFLRRNKQSKIKRMSQR